VASNLLIFFLRSNWPQCVKSTAKFGGLATTWMGLCPPPGPSAEPPLVPACQSTNPMSSVLVTLCYTRLWKCGGRVLWGCRCEKFISSSFRVRSTVSQKNARTSGHELLVELCASDSVYWPLFTGADFLGAMGVVAPIQNWLSGCGGAPKKKNRPSSFLSRISYCAF